MRYSAVILSGGTAFREEFQLDEHTRMVTHYAEADGIWTPYAVDVFSARGPYVSFMCRRGSIRYESGNVETATMDLAWERSKAGELMAIEALVQPWDRLHITALEPEVVFSIGNEESRQQLRIGEDGSVSVTVFERDRVLSTRECPEDEAP